MSDIKKIKNDYIDKLNTENNVDKINNIKSDFIWFTSDKFNLLFSFKRSSSFIFLRSDIFTDYFFSEIKQ